MIRRSIPAVLVALGLLTGCVTTDDARETASDLYLSSATAGRGDAGQCMRLDGEAGIAVCTRLIQSGVLGNDDLAAVFVRRGMLRNSGRLYAAALADMDSAVLLGKRKETFIGLRGIVAMEALQLDKAFIDLSVGLSRFPNNSIFRSGRALTLYRLNRGAEALADIDALFPGRQNTLDTLLLRAMIYRSLGRLDDALRTLDKALGNSPPDKALVLYEERGHVHYTKGDYAAAAADFERSIGQTNAARRVAWLFVAQTRAGDSAALEKLAARPPTPLSRGAALTAMLLGRITPNQVMSTLGGADARTQAEMTGSIWFFAGQMQLMKGNIQEAQIMLRRAAESNAPGEPEHAGAITDLGRLDSIPVPRRPLGPAREA